jgi:anthranilate/para-aminobenzoate synthase component I
MNSSIERKLEKGNFLSTKDQTPYFERACLLFQHSGFAAIPGSYFVHNKNRGLVKLGLGTDRYAVFNTCTQTLNADDKKLTREFDEERAHFDSLKEDLDADAPCFFLISGDLKRDFRDESLPLTIFVQPKIEFQFSSKVEFGEISYAKSPDAQRDAKCLLSNFQRKAAKPCSIEMPTFAPSYAEVSTDWERLESDEAFLERLECGIQALQQHSEGKMTMMRSFRKRVPKTIDRFNLYRTHSRDNGEYAFSHFFCLDNETFSIGCTPENAFEIIGDELHVDVVAATCKSGEDEAFEKRELTENLKQLKEHIATAKTRESRYLPFCVKDSMKLINSMQIKRLRNVCHLHSLIIGFLLPRTTMFDIIPSLFPIMGARPKELLPVSDSDRSPHRYYGGIVGHSEPGYFGCFLNLRNALIQGNMIHAKVGMGLIRESDASSELIETEDKISGLMEAVYLWTQNNSAE